MQELVNKYARGTDERGNYLDFRTRVNRAIQFYRLDVSKDAALISPDFGMKIRPLCLARDYGNLPMVIALLALGGDPESNSQCANEAAGRDAGLYLKYKLPKGGADDTPSKAKEVAAINWIWYNFPKESMGKRPEDEDEMAAIIGRWSQDALATVGGRYKRRGTRRRKQRRGRKSRR